LETHRWGAKLVDPSADLGQHALPLRPYLFVKQRKFNFEFVGACAAVAPKAFRADSALLDELVD
jgi:hypothetical protein